MPDNWSFVAAAYGLTALVLAIYWRRLVRKEKEVNKLKTTRTASSVAERSQNPSRAGRPRPEPVSRPPLQQ